MKSQEEIFKKLEKTKKDERLSYPKATVFNNAPLALIQLSLETTIDVLTWVLQDEEAKTENQKS